MDFEINHIRQMTMQMVSDGDFDSQYTFYYDETNNIRKFYLNENKFNASYDTNFVLGGVGYIGDKPNIDTLFTGLNLQKSIKEVKLKHIAKGDFISCLKSDKLNYFLSYLLQNDFYVHYSTLNILYFSIVDIVDSAIMNSEAAIKLGQQFALNLKNDLFKIIKLNTNEAITLFHKYEYPDIKKERLNDFIDDLILIFEEYENIPEYHIGLTSLRQIFKESKKKNSLPFIMDEEEFILLKDFSHFYLRPVYLFKNSTHLFDIEESIQEKIQNYEITDNGQLLKNYNFIDSDGNKFIQASDVFTGFVGKLFSFINTTTIEGIKECLQNLNDVQKQNLKLYIELINKTDSKNKVLFHNVVCLDDMSKMQLIFAYN